MHKEETCKEQALALPCAVQDTLLSQSCDPKDIEVRLQEDLQLEQASLENSKPETKRMETAQERAVVLPCAVEDALLSQTCDAKDVVVRLQGDLHLKQVSLENPEPEPKRMIRCLARKAKCSNRLDVVKHLREVTPAGTTGKCLNDTKWLSSLYVYSCNMPTPTLVYFKCSYFFNVPRQVPYFKRISMFRIFLSSRVESCRCIWVVRTC